jgi:serine protease Do
MGDVSYEFARFRACTNLTRRGAVAKTSHEIERGNPNIEGDQAMKIIRKKPLLVLLMIVGGFLGGWISADTFPLFASGPTVEVAVASPKAPASTTDVQPGRALAEQLSTVFEAAAAEVSPAVVPIFSEQTVEAESPFGAPDDPLRQFFGDDFFRHFFGVPGQGSGGKRTVRGLGSGVIVSPDGYILTNNHVVNGAEKLTVVLTDKKKLDAKVVGTDPQTDVAVIKVEANGLPSATLGTSDNLKVGQWVIAVGNPFQLMHTVTAGIISAQGRSSVGLADYEDFIQTDASINPGNSGGALVDLDGDVVGINTAISSPSGGNVGIGFAIPINMARDVMDTLIKHGKVTRGYLGVMLQNIDPSLEKALDLKSTDGALVADVTSGGPADKAGFKRGDVILSYNGEPVKDTVQIRNEVAKGAPGSSAHVKVLRDGQEVDMTVELAERPADLGHSQPNSEEAQKPKLGLSIQTLTPQLAQQLGYQNEHGVVVVDVESGSPADDVGLQRGDLIKEADRVPLNTAGDFARVVAGHSSGDSIALLVQRGPNTFYAAIEIP